MRAKISRRDALQKGLYGTSALLLGNRLAADAPAAVTQPVPASNNAKAKSVIQVFLWGGIVAHRYLGPQTGRRQRLHG